MESREAVWAVLSIALVAANLPFLSRRRFLCGPRYAGRALGARLLELLLSGLGALGFGLLLEARFGQIHRQGWAFYAAMACFYLTLAFPGFVWCCLRRRDDGAHA